MLRRAFAASLALAVLTIRPVGAHGHEGEVEEYAPPDEEDEPRFKRPPPVRLWPPRGIRSAPAPRVQLEPPKWKYYGWNFLLLDGASGIVAAVGGYPVLIFSYFAGPPIIHIAHERGWAGMASFFVRLAAPAIGAGIAYRLSPPLPKEASWYEAEYVLLGVALGGVFAHLVDAYALSWEPPRLRRLDAMLVPMPLKDGGGLAIGGVF